MAKTYAQMLPSIDRRLSTWVSIAEKSRSQKAEKIHPTITLSRQYGCEGFPLAEKLKEIFEDKTSVEWNIYDKALLKKVSEEEDLSMRLLEGLGDMTKLLDSLPITIPGHTPHSQMYRRIAQHLIGIAKIGRAIIIGRGGSVITQGFPNCYHFRLEAGFGFRAASMARRLGLTLPEAEAHVKENEKAREKFISQYLKVSTSDRSHFDAVYNNERHSVVEIAWSIFAYVMQDWQGKGAR
jgi:hypothetical protein